MPSLQSQRILVRGVNWLGDAVMTTPALLRLREARPDARIILLTHAKLAELWQGHPAVDHVETFADGESVWSIGRRLRAEKFDVGLVLPNSPRSALEVWLAGIPQRTGLARPWRNWFLTQAVAEQPGIVKMHKRSLAEIKRLTEQTTVGSSARPSTSAHQIHHYLHLAAALGAKPEPLAPQLMVTDEAVSKFVAKFKLPVNPGEPAVWLGLNAGAEYGPAKRWPEERFIQAAIQIQRATKCRWLIFGVKSEHDSALHIAANIHHAFEEQNGREAAARFQPAINLAGVTSLGELCAGLKLCRALLTNDSGPMHVAAAVGTPVVALFGSTSPELTGPGLPGDTRHQLLRAEVACSPCFLRECPIDFRCMKSLGVEQAVEAVTRAVGWLAFGR